MPFILCILKPFFTIRLLNYLCLISLVTHIFVWLRGFEPHIASTRVVSSYISLYDFIRHARSEKDILSTKMQDVTLKIGYPLLVSNITELILLSSYASYQIQNICPWKNLNNRKATKFNFNPLSLQGTSEGIVLYYFVLVICVSTRVM